MELIKINSYKHLELYAQDWTVILESNENTNPFIEYEFVYNWWKCIGDKQCIEIYAVKENNRMIAFFPFQTHKKWYGYLMHFIALQEANYMGFISKKVDLSRVIMFAMDEIIYEKRSVVFHLHGILESSVTPFSLSQYLIARNMKERYFRVEPFHEDEESMVKEKESSNFEWQMDTDYIRKIIFSTNTFRAKVYRNLLWAKEAASLKGK